MNYELAKELSEAGFPEGGKGTWTLPPESIVARRSDRVYVPTLEELIEACGDALHGFGRYDNGKRLDGWAAWGVLGLNSVSTGFHGVTPTQAVARLWLALNKKV